MACVWDAKEGEDTIDIMRQTDKPTVMFFASADTCASATSDGGAVRTPPKGPPTARNRTPTFSPRNRRAESERRRCSEAVFRAPKGSRNQSIL
jgi:hypothetical protein